ncbi:hypothetical protein GJA_4307 [Janthinobacterium agaricidamnosum NBRC 102515 = DSM 9628]|uniref:Uncharacterized protein n=1 Tax=Janthinobacterium agaricidamnosum NBRC 102515 = DSM 9628 TaxID=1349767 RepID=W0VBC8_9BURK|nr:hypothetical protein GJA_4307 [Janthinobacterium agaricidamnosum NBRC 102515 = DSM 9628]
MRIERDSGISLIIFKTPDGTARVTRLKTAGGVARQGERLFGHYIM